MGKISNFWIVPSNSLTEVHFFLPQPAVYQSMHPYPTHHLQPTCPSHPFSLSWSETRALTFSWWFLRDATRYKSCRKCALTPYRRYFLFGRWGLARPSRRWRYGPVHLNDSRSGSCLVLSWGWSGRALANLTLHSAQRNYRECSTHLTLGNPGIFSRPSLTELSLRSSHSSQSIVPAWLPKTSQLVMQAYKLAHSGRPQWYYRSRFAHTTMLGSTHLVS